MDKNKPQVPNKPTPIVDKKSAPAGNETIYHPENNGTAQPHNSKKEALGPNTNR